MFNRYTLITIIAFFSCLPGALLAQASLSLTTTSISDVTPDINTQLQFNAMLTNTSAVDTFEGIIDFSMLNDDSVIVNALVFGKPNYAGTSIKLAPQEQKLATFTVDLIPSYFKAGPEIIIVWPIATNAIIKDSALVPIDIQAVVGIREVAETQVSAFVSGSTLIIQNESAAISLEQVRIFDLSGAVALSQTLQQNREAVNIASLAPGSYITEILFSNGAHTAIRFIKQ